MRVVFHDYIYYIVFCALTGLLTLTACTQQPTNVADSDALPAVFPDYVGVTIPVGIAPMNFSMSDDAYTRMDVEVRGSRSGSMHVNGSYADFDIDEWHQLLEANRGGTLSFTVCALKDGQWTRFKTFKMKVSTAPLGEWGVTYRRIAPGYSIYGQMGIYQRDLSTFSEQPLIESSQSPGMCVNCHTANRASNERYVFHVRGEHGATVICKDDNDELLKAQNDQLGGSMVYPYWHPGGRYCAFSTNKTAQMFHTANNKRIEVYDTASDVFVYDTEKHQILNDSLIMKEQWAENTPAFSPDGKWLYFTTALRQDYPHEYDKERYSLCRVAFNEATGRLGTAVDTLVNARLTGKSVTWPRPSYDGRYVMYTQADYGYFSIWHPESDLWILDLTTGESHPLDDANSRRADSFHNWTTNSQWFLFTSRRHDGLYSHLYFACMKADGKATKPFLLPQRNPKRYYRESLFSFNTPDFVADPVKPHARKMGKLIEDKQRLETQLIQMEKGR